MGAIQDEERDQRLEKLSFATLLIQIALLLHFLAFILSAVSFFSPMWYIEVNTAIRVGLWGRCQDFDDTNSDCIWFHERNNAWEKSLLGWHKAAQVLFAIGISLLTLAFLVALGNLVFKCCHVWTNLPILIGCVIFLAMTLEVLSILVFGIGAYYSFEVSINSWVGHFEWAFFVGIAAIFICLFSGMVYVWGGIRYHGVNQELLGYVQPDARSRGWM